MGGQEVTRPYFARPQRQQGVAAQGQAPAQEPAGAGDLDRQHPRGAAQAGRQAAEQGAHLEQKTAVGGLAEQAGRQSETGAQQRQLAAGVGLLAVQPAVEHLLQQMEARQRAQLEGLGFELLLLVAAELELQHPCSSRGWAR